MSGRPIRLAVVSDAVQPFHTGGKEARYAAILPRLTEHGIDVDVWTMKWWPGREHSVRVGPLTMRAVAPLVPLYSGSRRSVWQAVVFAVCSLRLAFASFDVLEADAIPFVQLYPLWAVARVRRRPLVVTWHEVWGTDYWRSYLGPAGVVAAWLERTAARLPDAIVATSPDTGDRVKALRGNARDADTVVVVPPGLDPGEIAAVHPREGVGELLSVGRLLPNKNVDLVLRALARLRAEGRSTRLTVLGQGPERPALEALAAQLGVQGAVTFVEPYADRADVLATMAGARVLAFPSVREGFGMVALEALACGTPVVTVDHPDNFTRNLVVDGVTGRVCAPTVDALTDALADALDRRDDLARKAAASVEDYDWNHLAARVGAVVRGLIRTEGTRP